MIATPIVIQPFFCYNNHKSSYIHKTSVANECFI